MEALVYQEESQAKNKERVDLGLTTDDFVDFVDLEEWQRKAIVELEQEAYMEGVDECVRAFRQQKQGKGWFDAPHKNGFFTTYSKEEK